MVVTGIEATRLPVATTLHQQCHSACHVQCLALMAMECLMECPVGCLDMVDMEEHQRMAPIPMAHTHQQEDTECPRNVEQCRRSQPRAIPTTRQATSSSREQHPQELPRQ